MTAPHASAPPEPEGAAPKEPWLVPIRSLGPAHRERIHAHLLALDAHDRYLRFGYKASDAQVQRYGEGIDFEHDEIFGIYNRQLQLIAMAHLAFSRDPKLQGCAEFGVSVSNAYRGRGFGARLFERAILSARNHGVSLLFIHALSENAAMLKIAHNAGALLEQGSLESEAHLKLPPPDLETRVTEFMHEQIAQTDFALKQQAQQFWTFLRGLQEKRQGSSAAPDDETNKT